MQNFISEKQMQQFEKTKTNEQMWEPITFPTYPVKVKSCPLETKGSLKKLESLWGRGEVTLGKKIPTESYYSITLHNRDQLPYLDLNIALNIYQAFYNNDILLSDLVLDIICKVKWRVLKETVITERIFPF